MNVQVLSAMPWHQRRMRGRSVRMALVKSLVVFLGSAVLLGSLTPIAAAEDVDASVDGVGPVRNLVATSNTRIVSFRWDTPVGYPEVRQAKVCAGRGVWCATGTSGLNIAWGDIPGAGREELFEVQALLPDGATGLGTLIRARRPDPDPISPVLNIRGTSSATSVDLEWDAPLGAVIDGYQVNWGTGEVTVTDPRAQIVGLQPATRYAFQVTAFNSSAQSEPVDIVVTTTLDPIPQPTVPGPVIDARITGATGSSLSIDWKEPNAPDRTPPEYYQVRVSGQDPITSVATRAVVDDLAPNRTYDIQIVAVNYMGASSAVALTGVTPATTPSAPTNLEARTGSKVRQVKLNWDPPINDGGLPILRYDISWDQTTTSTSARTITLDVAEGARNYVFDIRAINQVGASSPHSISFFVPIDPMPRPDVPSSPRDVAVSSTTTTSVDIRWKSPSTDGGAQLTGYQIQSPGLAPVTTSETRVSVKGLRPNRSYTFSVVAQNVFGDSVPIFVTAQTDMAVPTPPRALVAVPRGSSDQMALSWLPPDDVGGGEITGYTVWWGSGEMSVVQPSALIMSLTPGNRYTFRVFAHNQAGSSLPAQVEATTPFDPVPRPQPPSAPRNVAVTGATARSVAVDWQEPSSPGGSELRYLVSVAGREPVEVSETTYLVRDIRPNTEVTISVQAINQMGSSDSVTVQGVTRMTTPDAPTEMQAKRGSSLREVRLQWEPPADDGGSPIRSYNVSWAEGTTTTTDANATIVVPNAGAAYTFSVTAVNDQGASPSASLRYVAPLDPAPRPDVPGAPRNVETIASTSSSIALKWQAPASDGGSDIQEYRIYVPGQRAIAVERPLITITDLAPNQEFTFSIAARNQFGESVPVQYSESTRIGIPVPPSNFTATPVSASTIKLQWQAPRDIGGGTLLGYRVNWGADEAIIAATELLVTDLTPATRYRFRISAINEAGESVPVDTYGTTVLDPQPRPRPPSPQGLQITGVTASTIALSWRPPTSDVEPAVTAYRVSDGAGRDVTVSSTSVLLRNLTPSTEYLMSVRSVSPLGESEPITVLATTAAGQPDPPSPGPGPMPGPQPFTPQPPPGYGDGDLDLDGDPLTVRQTAPGQWPKQRVDRSGRPLVIEKFSGFRTNAGQTAKLSVTKKSPSIKSVKLTRDNNKRVWLMTATLKPGASSGSVILTVSAPATQTQGKSYEPLQSSQQFVVRR